MSGGRDRRFSFMDNPGYADITITDCPDGSHKIEPYGRVGIAWMKENLVSYRKGGEWNPFYSTQETYSIAEQAIRDNVVYQWEHIHTPCEHGADCYADCTKCRPGKVA